MGAHPPRTDVGGESAYGGWTRIARPCPRDLLVARGLPIHSFRLGLSGQADVVEFSRVSAVGVPDSTHLEGRGGWWKPQPIEHKRGRAKRNACDRVQLCAQALCLEEMFKLSIAEGALFYGKNRRRTVVRFSPELRQHTEVLSSRMHNLFAGRVTPPAVLIPGCDSCSLKDRCLPELPGKRRSVSSYYRICLAGD